MEVTLRQLLQLIDIADLCHELTRDEDNRAQIRELLYEIKYQQLGETTEIIDQ